MGQTTVVMNDQITGRCSIHQIPNPTSGAPQPSPAPFPFAAPLTRGLATTVIIEGRPAAVVGSSGLNTPPHIGLHASDPYFAAPAQEGRVTSGSATVLFDGKPAAATGAACTCCMEPGNLTGSATSVTIG
jgi:uncharacterized Zn-binding protein involved in type VI secretion